MSSTTENQTPNQVLESYLHNVDSLNSSVPPMMLMLGEMVRRTDEKLHKFLQENGTLKSSEDGTETYILPSKCMSQQRKLQRQLDQYDTSTKLIPRNFLVSFVSEYDAFLGALMKCFYTKKPELLNGVERQISFSELMNFKSIDNAKQHILEKDVESMLRKSHADHFDILEKKFKIQLRKELECWGSFIEIMERRNLFVHCDGKVSSQYLSVCAEHKAQLSPEPPLNSKLDVPPDYLSDAHRTLREISIKLTHVLWRKVFPEEREQADDALLSLAYELIQRGSYQLSIKILEFAIALPHHYSDTYKRMFFINLAQAYKYSGETKKSKDLIAKLDWSSVSYKFKLAVAVLQEKYDEANKHMRNAGKTNELTEQNFLEWPLFKDYRETEGFKREFKSIFKKDPPEQTSATVNKQASKTTESSTKLSKPQTRPAAKPKVVAKKTTLKSTQSTSKPRTGKAKPTPLARKSAA